ncbi:hypothetical protein [Haloarcula laminariae]|uniref:hypothetical protein n=1 Tax=Haloarcula laminariae TaxID=2961577 RepID=UPI0021C71B66|nr:hypothetical protein [Halomicroarcula laminariae]
MKEIARRDTLQVIAGLASATAIGTVAGRHNPAPSTAPPDVVPTTADGLIDANIDLLRQDDGLRTLTTAALQQRTQYASAEVTAESPRDVDALLADVKAEFDTDPEKVHRATAFGDVGADGSELFDGYAGVVLNAELSAEDIKSGIANLDNVAFTELDASGTVVYEPESADGPWVGGLGSDRVVVGTEAAVYDAVDVRNGEAAAASERLEGAFADTRDGPVRFAGRLPDPSDNDAVPASVDVGGGRSIDLTPLDHVSTLGGAVYRDGDVRGLETTLDASDIAAASDVTSLVSRLRDRLESKLQDATVADIVGDVAVERDGATVTASVERTTEELRSLVERDSASY